MQGSKGQVKGILHLVQYLLIHKTIQVTGTLNSDGLHTASSEQTGVSIRCSQMSLKI